MRTVTVTGHGSVQVAPDVAVVRVSAVHRAPAVAEALRGASSAAEVIGAVARRHTAAEHGAGARDPSRDAGGLEPGRGAGDGRGSRPWSARAAVGPVAAAATAIEPGLATMTAGVTVTWQLV